MKNFRQPIFFFFSNISNFHEINEDCKRITIIENNLMSHKTKTKLFQKCSIKTLPNA